MNRRALFQIVAVLSFLVAGCAADYSGGSRGRECQESEKGRAAHPFDVGVALQSYSFHAMLMGKGGGKPFTLFHLLDWCAQENISVIDITGYYFPTYPDVPPDDYIAELKARAYRLGIQISGTGIRNDFASADPAVRARGVELANKWIVVAAKLGVPVIRLFAGRVPPGYEKRRDEVMEWMIPCFRECMEYGRRYGVRIAIQNHGGILDTGERCVNLMKALDSKWAGLMVDTGSFWTEDPYRDIETAAPHAITWQVKERLRGSRGAEAMNYVRLAEILKKSEYRGYLPVETLPAGEDYDPFLKVPEAIRKMRNAILEVYGDEFRSIR